MRKSGILMALVASLLAACGGSSDPSFQGGSGGGAAAAVSSVTLITSATSIPSDGSAPATISALVRNASNQYMTGVPVIFSANNNGSLLITQATTDSNGLATATLNTVGDPSARTVTVSALAGTVTSTVDVGVSGSTLAVQGPPGLTQGQAGTYTATFLDAGGKAVPGAVLTVTSTPTSTLTPSSITTNSSGQASFTMNAGTGGAYKLTVGGAGLSATQNVTVNADSFTITSPSAGPPSAEVALGTPQTISVLWRSNGTPVSGGTVNFATTRGTLSAATGITNGSGVATVNITSTTAGAAIVTASGNSSSAQVPLEFVAITPAAIDLQPSVFTVNTGQTSTITAVVRDAAGNLVKNKPVTFSLNDVTGGTLSLGVSTTDSQGRAQTVYTAGQTTSANGGVVITATVAGVAPKSVALTVAGRQVFLSIGTGNEISEPNTAQYMVEYIVQVTDSNGNGVASVPVSLTMLSQTYFKGQRALAVAPAVGWTTSYSVVGGCADEDVNRNGQLDAGEDFNASGRLEAGNIVTVTPSNATTDANGFVVVKIFYPQEFAYYLTVSLSARTTVQGTEYVRSSNFLLTGLSTDFNNPANAPPGPVSPFGIANSCANPN
ncbi:MAG: Ig-like domain-containing protein [Pseudomonadota bacterium]